MKIETQLPFFPGFYETNIGFDERMGGIEVVDGLEYMDIYDFLDINNKKYEEDVCKDFCKFTQHRLHNENIPCTITFKEEISPREYNYTTDRIFAEIEMTDEVFESIRAKIKAEKNLFEKYLKDRHTSCSGFVSFYSNNYNEWADKTKNFTEFDEIEFETVLVFLLSDGEDSIADDFSESFYDQLEINPTEYIECPVDLLEELGELIREHQTKVKEYFAVQNYDVNKEFELSRQYGAELKKEVQRIKDKYKEEHKK